MSFVPESLFEANFERGQSPKGAMGIGLEGRLYKDLEKEGYEKDDINISDEFVITPAQSARSYRFDEHEILQKLCIKHMDSKKKAIAQVLMSGKHSSSESTQKSVEAAFKDGVSKESLKLLIDNFSEDGNTSNAANIQLAKLTRTKEKEKFEDEYNTYIFIGYTDKVPVEVNGKQYYEDKFVVENMVKIDMYNPNDLNMVSGMKLRTRYQNYPDDSGGTFAVKVPAELMDEDSYSEIPDHMQEIIEKYKFKI